jgi:hypothetical protein
MGRKNFLKIQPFRPNAMEQNGTLNEKITRKCNLQAALVR